MSPKGSQHSCPSPSTSCATEAAPGPPHCPPAPERGSLHAQPDGEGAARTFQDCDPRSSPEPGRRGHHTLERRGCSNSDVNPFFCLPCSRCVPLRGARVRGAGGRVCAGATGSGQAGGTRAPGLGHDPSVSLGADASLAGVQVTEPLRDGSLCDGAAVARARKDLPAPPASPPSVSQETKALFVLPQATKETGKVRNFSAGATAPATLRGLQALSFFRETGRCLPRGDFSPSKPPPRPSQFRQRYPCSSARSTAGAGGEGESTVL